ncbi:hypothetical protein SSP531S_52050 [Streptomyces spongiicola]|uniref:Uncharacterized protein n=1 Tax=Streptomyces spongiicola TaxID=1690221 RepID=A0A388T462_9ACTN|nr:hypothetical protein SSP531S_52050 [Streptomyces spongiicola]
MGPGRGAVERGAERHGEQARGRAGAELHWLLMEQFLPDNGRDMTEMPHMNPPYCLGGTVVWVAGNST